MLGYGYGHLIALRPFSGLLAPFFAMIFGSLLGMGTSVLLRRARVRNLSVTGAVAFTVATVAIYAGWAAWMATVVRGLGLQVSFGYFFLHPARLWDAMVAAGHSGYWRFFQVRPTGTVLWLMWMAEAGITYAAALAMAVSQMKERGFCEGCGTWTVCESSVLRVPSEDFLNTRRHLEQHDLAFLATLGEVAADANAWTAFDLHSCRCGSLDLLDAYEVTRRTARSRPVESRRLLVARLILRPQEARGLRALAARQMREAVGAKAASATTRSG